MDISHISTQPCNQCVKGGDSGDGRGGEMQAFDLFLNFMQKAKDAQNSHTLTRSAPC